MSMPPSTREPVRGTDPRKPGGGDYGAGHHVARQRAGDEPHWYLRQIGIDPVLQGSGRGGLLMQACLADIDARGELAYLEATSESGMRFYERHGFTVLAKVQVGDSAPLWPMSRAPHRR